MYSVNYSIVLNLKSTYMAMFNTFSWLFGGGDKAVPK